MIVPPALERLIAQLARLPGIGEKSAYRLALFILNEPDEYARSFSNALEGVIDGVQLCERCFNLAEGELCRICSDPRRDQRCVCVVEGIPDLMALERSGVHGGAYHVLHGALSPLKGIGPGDLKIGPLLQRCRAGEVDEIILATNVDVEGEATAAYLGGQLDPLVGKASRIASGIPMGTDIEYMDQVTLARAFEGRRSLG